MTHVEIKIPDLGGVDKSRVIEVLIKKGQVVDMDQALITLESDKASMEVPSPHAGTVESLSLAVGDVVSEGDVIAVLITKEAIETPEEEIKPTQQPAKASKTEVPKPNAERVYAGPFVRRMAFELGIDLNGVTGSGSGGRITIEDMKAHLVSAEPQAPSVDYTQWGKTRVVDLTRIQTLSLSHLTQAWRTVPHVTQYHEADVTDLEAFRLTHKTSVVDAGGRLTMLVFVMKALICGMRQYPKFNSALLSDTQRIERQYFHIGFAVDTPNGLIVPVIRDVDQKSIQELAVEIHQMSEKARSAKLRSEDLKGGCASISSLGGIGGGHFSPIIHAPQAFILGVSRAVQKAMFDQGNCVPRLMVPLSIAYDHRLIDGADGARFMMTCAQFLEDLPGMLKDQGLDFIGS